MEIKKETVGDVLNVALVGRLDTTTAPLLEAEAKADAEQAGKMVLDLKELEYISSAGLRVLLMFQKLMNSHSGLLTIKNVNETVMEVFDMTGFSSFLTIEE